MASHLSDIGFRIGEETFREDMIEIIRDNLSKSARELSYGNKKYLVIYIDDIELWFPVEGENPLTLATVEIHYNTHRWEIFSEPEWVSKKHDEMIGLLSLWDAEDMVTMNVSVPDALFAPDFINGIPYKSQLACFVENIEIFPDVDSFIEKYKGFNEMSFIPTGMFSPKDDQNEDFEETAQAWINGVVEKSELKTNSYTGNKFYHMLIDFFDIKFDLLVDEREITAPVVPGNIVSANVWISGKIRNVSESED